MNNFKINADAFDFGTSKTIKVNLANLPDDIKIVDAVLSVKVESVTENSDIPVHYAPIGSSLSSEGWNNVDNVILSANDILKINISDELQDALLKEATHLQLDFETSNIVFAIDSESDFINIDYISLAEFQNNGSNHKINLGKSGQASVDLVTGRLSMTMPIMANDSNVLPLSISANFHSVENAKIPVDTGMPKHWHLNVSQFLIKENDSDGDLKFTYIDENGKNQIIEEKYYYLTGDEENHKEYVSRNDLSVNLDGEYIYGNKKIKTELVAPSGLKLVSSIADVPGSELVDYEPEELINVKNNIDTLTKNINSIKSQIISNKEQLMILALTKDALEKQANSQEKNIKNEEALIEKEFMFNRLNSPDFVEHRNAEEFWNYYYENHNQIPEDISRDLFKYASQYADKANDYIVEELPIPNTEDKYLHKGDVDVLVNTIRTYSVVLNLGHKFDTSTDCTISNRRAGVADSKDLLANIDADDFETILNNIKENCIEKTIEEGVLYFDTFTQNDISDFYKKHNAITLLLKDTINIETQISSLFDANKTYYNSLVEYKAELDKYQHQQKLYEAQVPVHYLYNDSNVIYGFGKTLDADDNETNTYRLILITDAYENTIFISYNSLSSNRIDSITDSSEKTIKFVYDGSTNYLKEIVDSRERKTTFVFDNTLLKEINHNGQKTLFSYADDSILQGVLSPAGTGAKFTYVNGQVSEVQAISVIEQVEHNVPTYKSCYKNDSSTFIDCLIEEDKINFVYNNYKSTTVSNTKNKTITYLFDKYGKVRSIYENSYTGNGTDFNPEEFSSNVTSFDYQDNKVTFKASKLPYSINYFEDVHFDTGNAVVYKEALSLGSLTCGSDCTPYSYPIYADYYSMPKTKEKLSVCLSEDMLPKINDISCSHKTFVLSAWAKADSAFVISDEEIAKFPDYIKNRKFEIRAEITYTDGTTDTSQHQVFDWRNTEWQYCALPITLADKTIAKMECFVDYTNNTNTIYFTDLELKEGDYEKTEYNADNLPVMKSTGHSEWETYYTYDEDQKLISETIKSKNTQTEYVTSYEYNKNGKIIKTTDYNNIVKESVYSDKGVIVKKLTYHKDEPANILYEETIIDDKGNTSYDVNEFGEKVVDYNYIDGTGITASTIDTKGVKTSYGYDHNDTLIQTTTTINGEENTNIYGYTLDLLTSLTHNNFDVKYAYDNKGRKTKISIADNEYLSKTYGENEEITTLASGESYKHIFDKNGNVLETYYKANETNDYTLIVQNIYDIFGNLLYTKDLTNGENIHTYDYDNFGQVVSEECKQHGVSVSIENDYDDNHSNIDHATIAIDGSKYEYDYGYSISPDSKLERITSDLGDETITYDKLGRIKKLDSSVLKKEFNYLKVGDHTSNLVSKINFATNGVINDNLSYKYDEKGNITEVRQYNKLVARYKYDALSRIIREDNSIFETTTTFEYDAGGNITCKKVYAFTIADNLDFEEGLQVIPYAYPISGWRDQLLSYNGESFKYDNLGNPTTYRNKELEWSHGRQLDKFADIAEFTYNANGIRTSKKANGFTTNYYLNGNKIVRQHDSLNALDFYYGSEGITGFHIISKNIDSSIILDQNYYYKKNLQGDIIGIIDSNGEEIVKYLYDAWGNHKATNAKTGDSLDISSIESYTNTSNIVQFIAIKNPFRYRSYYYDFETGLYYLNSRYYDPEIGRFINADDINAIDITKITLNGLNLYSYCSNNPVNETDGTGYLWLTLLIAFHIGAVTSALTSVATQALSGNGINGWEVLSDALFGGITGLLAVSGLGAIGLFFMQGLVSVANTTVNGLIDGEINPVSIIFSFIVGGTFGALGGKFNIQRVNNIEKSLLKVLTRDFGKSLKKGFTTLTLKSAKYLSVFVLPTLKSAINSIWQNTGINLIFDFIFKDYTIKLS